MKALLLYFALVGTPVAGLLLILRVGERIDAPPAVSGTWVVDDAFARAARRSCVPLDFPDQSPSLTISQSGRYLRLQFNDAGRTAMPGTLHAGTLTTRQVLPTGEGAGRACGAATLTELRLRLVKGVGGDRLSGHWTSPECEVCPALDVVAIRAGAD